MTWRFGGVMALALVAGCAIGPSTHVPEVVPEQSKVGSSMPSRDSAIFDSLARAAQLPPPVEGAAYTAQTADAIAWLDVLRDTTLIALETKALRDNRNIHLALARLDEYRALVGSARSELFPTITGNASAASEQIVFGSTPPVPFKALRLTADLQWELDFWGRIRKGLAAAEADRDQVAADERAAVLTLVADVADNYLELLELRQDLQLSRDALSSRDSTLRLARQRFAQGVISELDVRQFEADAAAAAAGVAQYSGMAAEKEHALSLLLGEAPGPIPETGSLDSAVAAIAVPDSVPSTLLLRRPDVESAERALVASTARLGETIDAILPRVQITGEYGRQSPTLSTIFGQEHEVYTLQAGVSVPIFAGGRQGSELAAARARVSQARATYEQAVLTALNEAADALVAVHSGRDQLAAQASQAASLSDAYRLAVARYQGGIASYLEVLDAQRGYFAAELALTQSRRNYLESTVRLYKALGGKWK
ncbi:MAG: efflux transporter outer membrane subunit [Gemmatimonadales bacterium]